MLPSLCPQGWDCAWTPTQAVVLTRQAHTSLVKPSYPTAVYRVTHVATRAPSELYIPATLTPSITFSKDTAQRRRLQAACGPFVQIKLGSSCLHLSIQKSVRQGQC